MNPAIERLRYHVSGAIERGEAQAIAGIPAPVSAADYAVTDGLHLAEIDGALLTICRASDGRALNFHGRALCKAFRDSVAYAGAAQAIRVYIKLAPYQAAGRDWQDSPYKSGRVPGIIAAMQAGGAA